MQVLALLLGQLAMGEEERLGLAKKVMTATDDL
jgi:hypothetical protein